MASTKKSASKTAAGAKRMGRPPKSAAERRTASLTLRLHSSERAEIEEGAALLDMTITDFLLAATREKRARGR